MRAVDLPFTSVPLLPAKHWAHSVVPQVFWPDSSGTDSRGPGSSLNAVIRRRRRRMTTQMVSTVYAVV